MGNSRKRRRGFGVPFNLTAPGTVFTIGFIALAISFGLLLSRGAAPKYTLSDPGPPEEYEIVENEQIPGQNNLQLRTIKFKSCASTVTVDLLLDLSGSMAFKTPSGQTKLTRLIEAVTALVASANDESVFGIQSFKSTDFAPFTPIVKSDVPVSFYKDVKDLIPTVLSGYVADGATPTYDALAFSRNVLREALGDGSKFKDRKFNFIFVSDGAPCPGVGCTNIPGPDKDPRKYDPNPADEIKALGVTVYSLGVFDGSEAANPQLVELLKSVATSPDHYYAASTGDEITLLLKSISTRICGET